MQKSLYIKTYKYTGRILLLFLIMLSTTSFADGVENTIIISGQVINSEHGNPIENHLVLIESSTGASNRYIKELLTDREGYYYDSIVTLSTKGSFHISTRDFENIIVDTTIHYRFMSFVAFDVIIANFKIFMPVTNQKLQARFEYFQKNEENRFQFEFVDITAYENITSWEWNFGDDQTSNIQNPVHIFNEPGVYKVSLTVTANTYNSEERNTITTLIYIAERSFCHMGGHAFTYYFPVDLGLAYLYLVDSNQQYFPVDTVSFDTLGFYIFYQIPVGNYVVKTQPDSESEYYDEMMPTYYGDVMFWNEAEIIQLNNTNWEYDIHMMHGYGMMQGNCLLNGNVVYNDLGLLLMDLPAERVDIYIFDDNDQLLGSHYSDEYGFFDFSDLSTGTYWLYPEVTGFEPDPLRVVLTDDDPQAIGIQVIIGSQGPDFIYDNKTDTDIIRKIYPNPAKSSINVEFETQQNSLILANIVDLQGRLMFSGSSGLFDNRMTIDISQLQNGTYILLLTNGELVDKQLFVVSE